MYVELFEADLELLCPADRLEWHVELAQAALTRNRDRSGTEGNKAAGPASGPCRDDDRGQAAQTSRRESVRWSAPWWESSTSTRCPPES